MTGSPNHYEVLGIGSQATPEEIERAYRFSLELYGEGALATYSLLDPAEVKRARARVQEAYDVLRDPVQRQAYDQSQGLVGAPRPMPSNVRPWPQPARAASDAPSATPSDSAKPVVPTYGASPSEAPDEDAAGAAPAPVAISGSAAPALAPVVYPVTFQTPPPASSQPEADAASAERDSATPVALPPPGIAPGRTGPAAPSHSRTPHVLAEPVTGAVLRRYREERGISLREIANQSKIGTRYLEYIEGDRHDMLPAAVYLRGFLQEYARALGLDPRRTANAYMAQFPRPWPQD
jgi:flagellar biosynthesis protein FlhG